MVSIKTRIVSYFQRVLGITEAPKPLFTKDYFKDEKFEIGDYTYGHPTVLFENDETALRIGKFCSISTNVTIFLGGNHRSDWNTTYPFNAFHDEFPFAKDIKGHPSTNGDVVIGNDVWIGQGVTIMSGITIGDGAILATNSVVTKNVGPYEIWGGNPSKLIRKRFDDAKIEELLRLKWWDKDLSFIEKNIELLCSDKHLNEAEWTTD
jgi:acetyltransferase-like isoleucine patch superfamily enzyme